MPTQDFIFQGSVPVWQPTKQEGYRFNIDSLLLAAWAHDVIDAGFAVLELGSGSAVVGLAMLHWNPTIHYTGIERQDSLAELSRQSLRDAAFETRASIVHQDIRDAHSRDPLYDVVVFNPPYFKPGHGRSSKIQGRREAREALYGDLPDFFRTATKQVKQRGHVVAVLRPERADEALACAAEQKLTLGRTLDVLHIEGGKHQLTLHHWIRDLAPTPIDHRQLVLHQRSGERAYTPEVDHFLKGQSRTLSTEPLRTKRQQHGSL